MKYLYLLCFLGTVISHAVAQQQQQQQQQAQQQQVQQQQVRTSRTRSFQTGTTQPQHFNMGRTEDGQEGYYAANGGQGAFPWWGGAGQGIQYADGGVRMGIGLGIGSGSMHAYYQRLRTGQRDQFTMQPYGPDTQYPPGYGPTGMRSPHSFPIVGAGQFGTGSIGHGVFPGVGGTVPGFFPGQSAGIAPSFGINNMLMF